jgi:hypothetical protein
MEARVAAHADNDEKLTIVAPGTAVMHREAFPARADATAMPIPLEHGFAMAGKAIPGAKAGAVARPAQTGAPRVFSPAIGTEQPPLPSSACAGSFGRNVGRHPAHHKVSTW